jgi:tartrate-resistant acid phosphatase type 5
MLGNIVLLAISLAFLAAVVRCASSDRLSFLVLGDWGKGGTSGTYGTNSKQIAAKTTYQMQIATAMGNYASTADPKPSFLVALGDNFYNNGVYSATDPAWKYLWQDVYLQFDDLNIPWYPVLGNHDYGYGATGVLAQLERSNLHTDDDAWEMPSTNYTKTFSIPGGKGGTVQIIFIDTTTLAPSVNKCCNEKGYVPSQLCA